MNIAQSDFVAETRHLSGDVAQATARDPRILFLIRSFGRGGAQRQRH